MVKAPEGTVSLDFGGKKPGRGAYVCHDVACLQKARKTRALERAFDTAIPPEVYDAMEAELRGADGPDSTFCPCWASACGAAGWPWARSR